MLRTLFDSAGNCYRCRNGLRWRKARKKRHDDHEAGLNVRDSSIEPADRGQNCTMDTPRARRRLFRDIRRCLLLSHSLRTSGFLCRAKQTTTRRSIHSLTTRTPSTRHPPHEISIGYRRATMTPRERRKFFPGENTITNTPVLPAPDCHRLLTSVLADHVCYLCNRSDISRLLRLM